MAAGSPGLATAEGFSGLILAVGSSGLAVGSSGLAIVVKPCFRLSEPLGLHHFLEMRTIEGLFA